MLRLLGSGLGRRRHPTTDRGMVFDHANHGTHVPDALPTQEPVRRHDEAGAGSENNVHVLKICDERRVVNCQAARMDPF